MDSRLLREADYGTRLRELLEAYDHPVLFCTGADTLNLVSSRREELARAADFLVAPQPVLDALNDKETVHRRAVELGLPVPREYDEMPDRFPVVIKPHCGEKAGLKARDRYQIARDPGEYARQYAAMRRYDRPPLCRKGRGAGRGGQPASGSKQPAGVRLLPPAAAGSIRLRGDRPPAASAFMRRP